MGAMASRWFAQPFVHAQIKENIKAPRNWPLCAGNSTVTGEFPAQRASNAENVSIWWRHYGTPFFITRGQFWPSGIVVACVCLSVCPSVCVCGKHLLARAITHHPSKLGLPNLDNRCKRLWLRSLLFCGVIDLDLQGQIELQNQNLPHFELVHAITRHQLKLLFPDLEQKCILALFRSLLILGSIEIDLQFNF